MGCLVNFYVITPRDEWLEVITVPNAHNFIRMQNAIPQKYHGMFHRLINKYRFLEQIIDNRDRDHFMKVNEVASQYETEDVRFDCRYCDESLLEVIRKTFFKTLFALRDDFNWDKFNYYMVVLSEDVMFEEIEHPISEPVLQQLAA